MSQVKFTSTSSVSFGELGPTTSLQLMFAKMQLELAETAKTQAMDKMDAISQAQDEQKLVSGLLNEVFSTQQRNFRIQECRDLPLHCLQISSGLCQ